MDLIQCPVASCETDGTGSLDGGAPMKCHGYGDLDPRCFANWLSIDPEDAGTYQEYLASLERGR